MRDDDERLRDILEAIERIEKYASRGREAFDVDELIQTWVLYISRSLVKLSGRSRQLPRKSQTKFRGQS